VEARRQRSHRGARVLDQHLRNVEVELTLDHERGRAGPHRPRREIVPVGLLAPEAEVEGAGPDAAAVVGEVGDLGGGIAAQAQRLDAGDQLAELHRPAAYSGAMPRYGSAKEAISPNAGAATEPP
jgi:hypothetical protein